MTATVRWPTEPGFNRAAADVVYKAMMELDDDSALMFGRILVLEGVRQDLAGYSEPIAKMLDEQARARTTLLKKRLARTVIAKSRRGEDNVPELAMLANLSKDYDQEEARDWRGRWATHEGRRFVDHTPVNTMSGYEPMKNKHSINMGIPLLPKEDNKKNKIDWSDEDKAHYQQAYAQIAQLVAPYRRAGNQALLHLHVADNNGVVREEVVKVPATVTDKKGDISLHIARDLHPEDRIVGASVSTSPTISASGAAYDVFAAAGAPRLGGAVAGGMQRGGLLHPKGMATYREKLDAAYNEQQTPEGRAFARLGASSEMLRTTLGPAAPPKAQMALLVGEHLGKYGPEAQKVIGPAADRAAYRYRGTERKVDPELGRMVERIKTDVPVVTRNGTPDRDATIAARREALIHGFEDEPTRIGQQPMDQAWTPSRLLEYYGPGGKVLPKSDLNTLQRKAGNIPPSQGVIIDDKGNLAVQAAGFGDDWYLPFNLKNLKALKGGEYVRTRTFGGLTTEDVYAGLMSGARSMTVVSHSGVFTMEFDPTLRGGRRFNDKALAMTGRYGHLLDAVQSRDVAGNIHPSRMQEIRDKAATMADPVEDKEEYDKEVERLKKKEMINPTLSEQQKNEAALDFLQDQASKNPDLNADTPEQLARNVLERQAAKGFAAHVAGAKQLGVEPVRDLDFYRRQAVSSLASDDPQVVAENVAGVLGKENAYKAWMDRAAQDNKINLTPLQLDANGYRLAQDALKEQFPYYIARTDFHRWNNANASHDTGYVMPKHNRPAEVLSGYYNPQIEGHKGKGTGEVSGKESGKYRASSTRFQNYPVRQGKLEFTGEKPEKKTGDTESKVGGGKSGKISEADAEQLRDDVTRRAAHHLLDQTEFAPGAEFQNQKKGTDLSAFTPMEAITDSQTPAESVGKELKELFVNNKNSRDWIDEQLADPVKAKRLHTMVLAAYGQAQRNKDKPLFNLDQKLFEELKRAGKPAQEKEPEKDTSKILRDINTDYAWGSKYSSTKTHTAESLEQTYAADPKIKALVKAKLLPEQLAIENKEFETAAQKLGVDLGKQQSLHIRTLDTPGKAKRGKWINDQAVGLHRAKQLRRRFDRSVEVKAEEDAMAAAQAAAAAAEQPQVSIRNAAGMVMGPKAPGESDEDWIARHEEAWRRVNGGNGGSTEPPLELGP